MTLELDLRVLLSYITNVTELSGFGRHIILFYISTFIYNGAIVLILIPYSNIETRKEGFVQSEMMPQRNT